MPQQVLDEIFADEDSDYDPDQEDLNSQSNETLLQSNKEDVPGCFCFLDRHCNSPLGMNKVLSCLALSCLVVLYCIVICIVLIGSFISIFSNQLKAPQG